MNKFKIYNDSRRTSFSHFLRIENLDYQIVTCYYIENSFNIEIDDVMDILDGYNTFCDLNKGGIIFFNNGQCAQEFIDIFLNPHEIAFKLNIQEG